MYIVCETHFFSIFLSITYFINTVQINCVNFLSFLEMSTFTPLLFAVNYCTISTFIVILPL